MIRLIAFKSSRPYCEHVIIALLISLAAPIGAHSSETQEILSLYAKITHKTVLSSPSVQQLDLKLDANAAEKTAALIEAELTKLDYEVVPDGEKFVRVLRSGWRTSPLAP